MSSSIKDQTIGGYVSEFAKSHKISVMAVMQSAMFKEFLKSKSEQEEGVENK